MSAHCQVRFNHNPHSRQSTPHIRYTLDILAYKCAARIQCRCVRLPLLGACILHWVKWGRRGGYTIQVPLSPLDPPSTVYTINVYCVWTSSCYVPWCSLDHRVATLLHMHDPSDPDHDFYYSRRIGQCIGLIVQSKEPSNDWNDKWTSGWVLRNSENLTILIKFFF